MTHRLRTIAGAWALVAPWTAAAATVLAGRRQDDLHQIAHPATAAEPHRSVGV